MKGFLFAAIALMATLSMGAAPEAATTKSTVVLSESNTVLFNQPFYDDTVANLIADVRLLDSSLPSGEPIYLILSSPGGSIDAGLEAINNLKSLNRQVKTITLFAASMGFQTVQGLGERLIVSSGTLMSHKARGGFYGEFPGQIDSRYGHWLNIINYMDEVAVSRTRGKHTMKSYKDLIENEYWCLGAECVKQGFADRVVNATCDSTLRGTRTREETIIWFAVIKYVDTYDRCPLNTTPLKTEIFINGKPLEKYLQESEQNEKKKEVEEVLNHVKKHQEQRSNKNVIRWDGAK